MSSLVFMLALLAGPVPDEILATGAKLEKLWGEGAFTEGGALAGDGSILFSDIGDRIMKYDPRTGAVSTFRDPSGRVNS
jgi:gluconolactonase